VLFHAHAGEARILTSPRSYAEYSEEGSVCHWTTGDIALHISLHSAFQWCARLDQEEDIPNPLPPMAAKLGFISRIDSAPERGACRLTQIVELRQV
jgi:hypothetical protein